MTNRAFSGLFLESRPMLSILSFTLCHPNPAEPALGLFVRARLQEMSARAQVKVIAPIPLFDYIHPYKKLGPRSAVPFWRKDGNLEVYHPRWLYPPLGTPLNIFCLFVRLVPLVVRIRKTFHFDVIDSHFGYPEGVVAGLLAALFGCPFTMTLRGNETKFAQYRFRRPFIRWALLRASRVITVSEELRKFAMGLGAEPAKVKTIPNGIDPDIFGPCERHEGRRKYGIPDGCAAIVCVGELVERKGHHRVVRSLRRIVDEGIDSQIWVAGAPGRDGPDYQGVIRGLAAELGVSERVHLLGFVGRTELRGLLSAADVFCLPSTLEGWPNAVHEASACGAPVVATAVGGVPDMLPSEEYGLVVPVGDQPALDAALLCALRKSWDREAISAWGRSRSWNMVAAEALREIANACSQTAQVTPKHAAGS
jgi:glycosyltransferase involved in cell wall biosynthesis